MAINALADVRRLKSAGVETKQAEAIVETIHETVTEGTVTKGDLKAGLAELRTDLKADQADLQAGLAELRTDMKADLSAKADKADLETGFASHKADMREGFATKGDLLRLGLALAGLIVVGFGAVLAMLARMLP